MTTGGVIMYTSVICPTDSFTSPIIRTRTLKYTYFQSIAQKQMLWQNIKLDLKKRNTYIFYINETVQATQQ